TWAATTRRSTRLFRSCWPWRGRASSRGRPGPAGVDDPPPGRARDPWTVGGLMGAIPGFLLRHTVIIRPFLGEGPFGPSYGEPVQTRAWVDERRRLVRDPEGAEVVSEATVYLPPGT